MPGKLTPAWAGFSRGPESSVLQMVLETQRLARAGWDPDVPLAARRGSPDPTSAFLH